MSPPYYAPFPQEDAANRERDRGRGDGGRGDARATISHTQIHSAKPATGKPQTHHLPRRHAHRLDRELAPTHVEQVLQARAQKIDDEDVVQALLPKVVYLRDAGCMTMITT